MAATIFEALPGTEVPVGGIAKSLAKMWNVAGEVGMATPESDDVKATQVNFVLHLGYKTTSEDAVRQFQTAVRFSKKHPCRVVVLCPMNDDTATLDFRAKIYGECHPGKTRGDMRCCEFVMLSYPMRARQFLESQVSVCLSTDLPLYYWVHKFSSSARLNDYQYLLTKAKRVLIDRGLAPADAANFAWPKPEAVRDLVHARLLPVRQSIGQFLSGFAPAALGEGLRAVTVSCGVDVEPEARALAEWATARLAECGASEAVTGGAELKAGVEEDGVVRLTFGYGDDRAFEWKGHFAKRCARFDARYEGRGAELRTAISMLSPEAALSEAMFF